MKAIKIMLIMVCVLILMALAATGINILQKGGAYDGRSMEKILGVGPEKATLDDIKKLGKGDIFQIYYASKVPSFENVRGEYTAVTVDVGIMASGAAYFTHHFSARGVGRARLFIRFSRTKDTGITFSRMEAGNYTGHARWTR